MNLLEKFKKIPNSVYLLGLVSFFNDTASEMLYPIMPIFLTQILGAPVFVVGIIEGVAEGTASLLKTYFGYWSDRIQKRKPFIVLGYSLPVLGKIIIALAYIWPMVFLGRFVDRFGKGVRTGPRDALLLEASDETNKGLIFGFHRSMDTLGAVVGPLIALGLLSVFNSNIRLILFIAVVPALLSLLFFFFLKETKRKVNKTQKITFSIKGFPGQFKLFLLGLAIFSLGNSSDTFLILRAKNLGLSLVAVILAYAVYNLVYALASTPAGSLSDKIGTKKIFISGIIIYAFVYLAFGFNKNPTLIWPLFAIYGFYIALTDGISKAFVGSLIPKDRSGTAYGLMTTVTSIFTLFASLIAGFIWTFISPQATFFFASICGFASLFIFLTLKEKAA